MKSAEYRAKLDGFIASGFGILILALASFSSFNGLWPYTHQMSSGQKIGWIFISATYAVLSILFCLLWLPTRAFIVESDLIMVYLLREARYKNFGPFALVLAEKKRRIVQIPAERALLTINLDNFPAQLDSDLRSRLEFIEEADFKSRTIDATGDVRAEFDLRRKQRTRNGIVFPSIFSALVTAIYIWIRFVF